MPTLNWLGKDKIINHANKIPFHVLNHKYNFQAKINSLFENSEINTGNKIIHGDNLIALKSLLPEYAGKIKCVYIDPPYNTGNENWVYNDNVNDPKFKKWLGEVVGKEGEDLTRHDKWLCMMYPRLQLLKQLLSDDGAIFISIDDNEQANLKLLCDEIFGANNFVANIAWKRKKELSPDSKNVSIQGEYILCYSKSENLQLASEKLSDEYIRKSYKTPTPEFPLDYWRPVPITVSKGLSGGGYEYTITTPTGKEHTKLWAYPEHSYQDLLKNNRVYFGKDGNAIPQRVMYLSESQGKPTSNYWDNVSSNKEGKKEILNIFGNNVFHTPKPASLIQKILQLASSPDSIILDSFAGSGTTAHAVLNLNKLDGGSRKFILIELEDYADNITAERVKRVMQGYNNVEGTGGSFDFYEVGEAVIINNELNKNLQIEEIYKYIWHAETGENYKKLAGKNYFIGFHNDKAIYFYYNQKKITRLDMRFINKHVSFDGKAKRYIIYADSCALSNEYMTEHNIEFRKIMRDIKAS